MEKLKAYDRIEYETLTLSDYLELAAELNYYKKALGEIAKDDCRHESYEDHSDVCFRLQEVARLALNHEGED